MSNRSGDDKLLPPDLYALTDEDIQRFNEEAELGMVVPNHPVLTQTAREVAQGDIASSYIQGVVKRLHAAAEGQRQGWAQGKKRRTLVGLAAPQIGESVCIILVDTTVGPDRKAPGHLMCFINPEIVWRSRETAEGREGCFSAGPIWGLVRRPVAVKVRAFDVEGRAIECIVEDFTARIMQHEIDHLHGVRFADRITSDRKRHWVHTEELAAYPKHIRHWKRLCSRERWESFKQSAR